jgi:hypothetical protein
MEERAKFDSFHRRAAGLVRQLVVQTTKDKKLNHRSQEDLQKRLIEQSLLLKESELELKRLRIEVAAHKAEPIRALPRLRLTGAPMLRPNTSISRMHVLIKTPTSLG